MAGFRKPGGNLPKMEEAVKKAADILKNGSESLAGKPLVSQAADKVMARQGCNVKDLLTKDSLRENGLIAGGAAITADGVRRIAMKNADGNRQIGRGVAQTAAGVGVFTAGLIAKRAQAEKSGSCMCK